MALTSLRLTDIPDTGLGLEGCLQPDEIALAVSEARVVDALFVAADIQKVDAIITVRGAVTGRFIHECVRCLKEYDSSVTLPLQVHYRHRDHFASDLAAGERNTLGTECDVPGGEDSDVYEYEGDMLELGPMLREQVILGMPMHPLCQNDCLGLCPVCGQDRNERLCDCREQGEASPFAILRTLRANASAPGSKPKSQRH